MFPDGFKEPSYFNNGMTVWTRYKDKDGQFWLVPCKVIEACGTSAYIVNAKYRISTWIGLDDCALKISNNENSKLP